MDGGADLIGGLTAHEVVVGGDYGSMGAGAEAGVVAEGELAVGGVSFGLEAQFIQGGGDHRGGAGQVAGRTPTDFKLVVAGDLETEVGVEGGDSPDIVDGGTGEAGHFFDRFLGNIADGVFDGQQGGEDRNSGLLLVADSGGNPFLQAIHLHLT